MNLAMDLLRGVLVGMAGLLPGLCGSTLLVIFGLYRPLTAALARPFENPRAKIVRFGPFFVAAGLGLLLGSRLLATLFARYEISAIWLFMGFMIGGVPELLREVRRTEGTWRGWLAFGLLMGACIGLAVWQQRLVPRGEAVDIHWVVWVLAGGGIGLGSIMPGVSVAFVLIHFGIYQPMLEGAAALQLRVLAPIALGAAVVIMTLARAADWLFRNAEGAAIRGVLGLVMGSILLVYPGCPPGISRLTCPLLFVAGAGISMALNRYAPRP